MKLSKPIQPTLFHNQFWSSSKPAYVLKALNLLEIDGSNNTGAKFTLQLVTEKQLKEDPILTELNPQRRLPFFYDPTASGGNGGLKLNESSGLIEYLLETYDTQHKLWPAPGEPTRAEFFKLVAFGPGTAYHICVPILFGYMSPGPGLQTSPQQLTKKKQEWHTIVAPTYEHALTTYGGPFLLGEKFTAADIVTGYDLMTMNFATGSSNKGGGDGDNDSAKDVDVDGPAMIAQYPRIKAYFDLICQCPIYKELYQMPSTVPPPTTADSSHDKTAKDNDMKE